MIKIELTFTTIAEAAAFLAGGAAPNVSASAAPTAPTPSKQRKPADSPASESKPSAEKPSDSPAPAGEPAADETPKVEYADLQKAVMALVAISTEEMKKIVDSFGIKTFKGSDASIWPAALKKINDRLAELKTEEGMA